jgi:hypothetical protein
MKKLLFAAAGVVASFCLSAQADSVYWNFSPSGQPQSSPSSNPFAGLTVSAFSQNNNNGTTAPFTTTSASSAYTTAAGFTASGSTNIGAAVLAGALSTSTSTYLAFSLSLDSSSTLSYTLTDISFGSRSTGTGPQTLSLYVSTDGFTSDFTSLGSVSAANNSTWAAKDFSGLSLSVPNDDSTLSFRIYGSGVVGTPTAGTATWRVDDVGVTLVPVPEPSILALCGLGFAGLLIVRRNKK